MPLNNMQVSNSQSNASLLVRSETFPPERIKTILSLLGIYHQGHFEYPVSELGRIGNHLDALFLIDPIVAHEEFIDWIVEDLKVWMEKEKIDCDLIFAPQQATVKAITEKLAKVAQLPVAYWQVDANGWFGNGLASGIVKSGSKTLVFNAVSLTGRCIGERLPSFAKEFGAEAIASAAFAIGTTDGARVAKERFQRYLYAAIDVPLHIFSSADCPMCTASLGTKTQLIPWTLMRDQIVRRSP